MKIRHNLAVAAAAVALVILTGCTAPNYTHVYVLDEDYPAFDDMDEARVASITQSPQQTFDEDDEFFRGDLFGTGGGSSCTILISEEHYTQVLKDMGYVNNGEGTAVGLSHANAWRLVNAPPDWDCVLVSQ